MSGASEPMRGLPVASRGPTWRVAAEATAWFVGALLLRAGLARGLDFDGLWGQDAWGYVSQGHALVDWMKGGATPVARWPQGYPLLGVLLHRIGWPLPVAMQWTSLLAGAVTVPLVWLAGRAWWPQEPSSIRHSSIPHSAVPHSAVPHSAVPRVAALLVAVAPVHLVWSLCATSDATAVAWLAAAVWMLGRAGATRHPSAWMVGVGISMAMALATRLAAGLVIPAVLCVIITRGRQQPIRSVQVAAVAFIGTISPQIVLWSLAPRESVAHPWLLGWRPWHAWQRSFDTVDGVAHYTWPQGVFAAFPAIHPGYLGVVGGLLAAVGIAALCWPQAGLWRQAAAAEPEDVANSAAQPARALLLAWVGVVALFFAGMPFQNFRFGLIALMPWALLAALGARRIAERNKLLAAALLMATLAVQGVWGERSLTRHVNMAAERTAAARHIAALLPRQATVIAFGLTADIAGRSGRSVIELATTTPAALARLWPTTQPVFVVVDPDQIRRQWRGKPVAERVAWLRAHTHLRVVDRAGRWGIWEARR